jgi:hypothetical protein
MKAPPPDMMPRWQGSVWSQPKDGILQRLFGQRLLFDGFTAIHINGDDIPIGCSGIDELALNMTCQGSNFLGGDFPDKRCSAR